MVRKDEVKYSDHNNEHEPADDIKSTPPAAPPHNTICDHICKGLCDLGIQRETMKRFTAMTIITKMCANGTFSTMIMWEEITTYKLPGEKDTTPGFSSAITLNLLKLMSMMKPGTINTTSTNMKIEGMAMIR